MNLLFVDLFSPEGAPYEPSTLEGSALGGTEATALRVATGLSEHHRVWFAQKSRQERVHYGEGLEFLSYSEVLGSSFPDMDAIIVLKRPRGMDELRIRFPSASLFLWLHDYLDVYPFRILRRYRRTLLRNKAQIIAVSRTHARATASLFNEKLPIPVFRKLGWAQSLRVGYVYNPIPDDLMPDGTKPDLCSLIFFSSPNKGLEQVMELFFLAKKHLPLLKFHIANPGYFPLAKELSFLEDKGIFVLGELPHKEILRQVREALCVFYPQTIYPETFGLIYAEADAVGTPVLAHDFGSAGEILFSKEELVNGNDSSMVINRLEKWHKGGRPFVEGRPEFRMTNVLSVWERLLSAGGTDRWMVGGF